MFYVKEKLNDAAEVSVGITDENVFCRCPVCGCEVKVDLMAIFEDEDADLTGTAVMCDDCGKDWWEKRGMFHGNQ